MADGIHIESGSVTLANGSATIIGLNTTLVASGVKEWDIFTSDGNIGYIDIVTDDENWTLKSPWAGTGGSGQDYTIERMGRSSTIVENQVLLEGYIRVLQSGLYQEVGDSGTLADRSNHDDEPKGFVYRVTDDDEGSYVYYIKASVTNGDWVGPASDRGDKGDVGPTGPSFDPDATGDLANRDNFDVAPAYFSYLDDVNNILYFKDSAANADWSGGTPFGRGDKGDAATIAVGTVTTGAAGTSVSFVNSGTTAAAIIDVEIPKGDLGYMGWSPEIACVEDGVRRVLKVDDWIGGEGTKPPAGQYIGLTGFVVLIADAVDIRGATGTSSAAGNMFQSQYDLTANGKVDVAEYAETVEWNSIRNRIEELSLIYGVYQ